MREERDRIRAEYRRRDTDERLRSRYDPNDPAVRYARDRLRAEMRSLLADRALLPLGERRILEVGCGSGAALEDLVAIGAIPSRLRGVDLSHERLSLVPAALRAGVVQADAAALPFADDSFDIVAQFTTLSSILDPALRRSVANEMRRVLRPGGAILWYDMRRTAPGSRTVPLPVAEIRALFPRFDVTARFVTLAPPLARRLAPRLSLLADALAAAPFLRTHVLAVARSQQ